jgi:Cu/Ag efflux protein CusF
MSRALILLMAAALLASLASIAGAQVKTITGDMTVVQGTVEAIDHAKRVVTIKDNKGKFVTVDVPAGTDRFSAVKIGDKISIRYYDIVSVRLKPEGEAAVDSDSAAATPAGGAKPAGTIAKQRTITATIQEIDPNVPSITFVGPNGWKYSRRVEDKKALAKVKVGDRVDITWTEAMLVDVK